MNRKNSLLKTKKTLVALSGGVDSAVTAAILKKRGFEVSGVFFDFGLKTGNGLEKAQKIGKTLEIPVQIVEAKRKFKKKIIDYFIKSYKKGLTPNPCIVCNKEMKFGLMIHLLKKYKAEYIATGHYARLCRERKVKSEKRKSKESFFFKLCEARDKSKDQSYFLYKLNQGELSKIIFPLGDLKKTEVKKMAGDFGLPVFENEESQNVCFLPNGDTDSFLEKHIKPKEGNIIDEKKNIVGRHKGLSFYTIGQRKGIEIGGSGPYFVIQKNEKKNELIVSSDPEKLLTRKFEVVQLNWTGREKKFPAIVQVQIRYHSEKIPAIIKKMRSGRYAVETKKVVRAVTAGQSAVFYNKNEVLGGGIITN